MKFDDIILKFNLKKLVVVPIAMLLLAIITIYLNMQAGSVPMGIELKGGTLITVYKVPEGIDLKSSLKNLGDFKVSAIRELSGDIVGSTIETNKYLTSKEEEELKASFKSLGISEENIAMGSIGPSISAKFLREIAKAVLFAFVFMGIVVFLRFKTFVPSAAVIFSAFSDIVTTLAIMIILGIELSSSSFVALLLLIGYSVDTDMLLTARLLMRKTGSFEERFAKAAKTGLTMTFTTIAAVGILYLLSTSAVLKEIASVILIGLLVDIINTWIQNAQILRWYLEREITLKGDKRAQKRVRGRR